MQAKAITAASHERLLMRYLDCPTPVDDDSDRLDALDDAVLGLRVKVCALEIELGALLDMVVALDVRLYETGVLVA